MSDRLFAVITTVQEPTASLRQWALSLSRIDGRLLVVGDAKGPSDFQLEGAQFLSIERQLELDLKLAQSLPANHYARKNLGYLVSMLQGACCIYETDDDNSPLMDWKAREETIRAVAARGHHWANVYRLFTARKIWPRGFPLGEIVDSFRRPIAVSEQAIVVRAPVQQGLANGSPDVDAVWRLVLDEPFDFDPGSSVLLMPGTWCPFNSQSTWWWPLAYPLMYLPSHCSFRMTDIWRSFIAQRCLWELGLGVVFHSAEVTQQRNQHNLMKDFTDEIPGYLGNHEIARILAKARLRAGVEQIAANMLRCYEALIAAQLFPIDELALASAWVADLSQVARESVRRPNGSICVRSIGSDRISGKTC